MDSKVEDLEEKLRSLLFQLQAEFGILDRIVYKGKNQHRHGRYFQYLMKVRRDLRLLMSMRLEDILKFPFLILDGSKPSQMLHLLERLKKNKCGKKRNFMEQILGAARLLSDMVEPMLKAAEQLSCLLARSFFAGFCLALLAVLARIRVLVQQILIDIVSVFNATSLLSQRKHSVKLKHEGAEIFREYYPPSEDILMLECKLVGDKFVLLENVCSSKVEEVIGEAKIQMEAPVIKYSTLASISEGSFLEGKNETDSLLMNSPSSDQTVPTTNIEKLNAGPSQQPLKVSPSLVVNPCNNGSPDNDGFLVEGAANESRGFVPESPTPTHGEKMAFIQVRKPTIESSKSPPSKRARIDQLSASEMEVKDSLYSLFNDVNAQDTIF